MSTMCLDGLPQSKTISAVFSKPISTTISN